MNWCLINNQRLLKVAYLKYDRKTETFGSPRVEFIWTKSRVARNINDIAARYARQNGIKWDKLIAYTQTGDIVSQRIRMYHNLK